MACLAIPLNPSSPPLPSRLGRIYTSDMLLIFSTCRDLLQLVDHARDEILPSLGVHVHDEQDNECTWMVLPPDRRKGRQQRLEEEAAASVAGDGGGKGADAAKEPGDTIWVDGDETEEPRVDDAGRRRE